MAEAYYVVPALGEKVKIESALEQTSPYAFVQAKTHLKVHEAAVRYERVCGVAPDVLHTHVPPQKLQRQKGGRLRPGLSLPTVCI